MNTVDYEATDIKRSPCLNCVNIDIDKRLCSDHCPKLRAYRLGQDYTKKEYFIVSEGKNLIEDIEDNGDNQPDALDFEENDELEEEIDDIEEAPGPVKHIPPEASWKKTVKPKTAVAKCAICGKPEDNGNKFLRGVCCNPCYNRWYRGVIEHPVLGKFKTAPWAPKEVVSIEKKPGSTKRLDKATAEINSSPITATDDICLTTININLEQYPQIREAVYRMAVSLSLPVSHVAVTLLAEALENRKMGER